MRTTCCCMPRPSRLLASTLTPFLYPCLDALWLAAPRRARPCAAPLHNILRQRARHAQFHSSASVSSTIQAAEIDTPGHHHLSPAPDDYSSTPFIDACVLSVGAGAGGHGCISFLREKYIANGPPNGGDGGYGGSIYIQAVRGETSLHKIARRGKLKAGRGRNGQGSLQGGARGEDILITVPVGTVVREVSRVDPLEDEERKQRSSGRCSADNVHVGPEEPHPEFRREKWLIYPGTLPRSFSPAEFPALPGPRRTNLASLQPAAPLQLDLDKPMDTPMLLAAGAMGGMGNPHFVTRSLPRPKFATKGEAGMTIDLQLELKLLADVGLVGLPNAGKSTLLRALTRSRTRVGNWAFTTLSPNIGTLVLDTHVGRPALDTKGRRKEPRTNLTIADIPGLIEGAHLDKGLGLGFLRHIERAAVLTFVVDLGARDAVTALKDLWTEVGEYEKLRERELNAETQRLRVQEDGIVPFRPLESSFSPGSGPKPGDEGSDGNMILTAQDGRVLPPLSLPSISSKPWLVVGTKADLKGTQDNYARLCTYLEDIQVGRVPHPSGMKNGWRKRLYSVPVSAINKEGVSSLPSIILRLLED